MLSLTCSTEPILMYHLTFMRLHHLFLGTFFFNFCAYHTCDQNMLVEENLQRQHECVATITLLLQPSYLIDMVLFIQSGTTRTTRQSQKVQV